MSSFLGGDSPRHRCRSEGADALSFDELEVHELVSCWGAVAHGVQKEARGALGEARGVLANCRNARDGVLGECRVVKAHERDVPGHAEPTVDNGAQRAEGDDVAEREDGREVARALEAKKLSGEDVMVVNCRSVKPLDEGLLKEIAGRDILTYEEGYAACGFGSAVAEFYACRGEAVRLLTVAAPECVVAHATADEQAEQCRLTASDLAAKIRAFSSRA